MHMSLPAYDTRRGSSLHKSVEGYDEANAIDDRIERSRALATVRSAGNRKRRLNTGAPSAHQVTAILSDALALLLDDSTIHAVVRTRLRESLRRAIRYRLRDPDSAEVRRVVLTRMRANPRIIEMEAQDRIEADVAASMARRPATYEDTVAMLDALRDDDDCR